MGPESPGGRGSGRNAPRNGDMNREAPAARWLVLEVGAATGTPRRAWGARGARRGARRPRERARGKLTGPGCLKGGTEPRKKEVIPDETQA